MIDITVTINSINGLVKISIRDDNETHALELNWCQFNDNGQCGFIASFFDQPIIVTEVAAEQFLNILLARLITTISSSDDNDVELKILDNFGEEQENIRFLPPTFTGNEGDLKVFVSKQDVVSKLYRIFEESNQLNSEVIESAMEADVLDDFLSLIQIKLSNYDLKWRR